MNQATKMEVMAMRSTIPTLLTIIILPPIILTQVRPSLLSLILLHRHHTMQHHHHRHHHITLMLKLLWAIIVQFAIVQLVKVTKWGFLSGVWWLHGALKGTEQN